MKLLPILRTLILLIAICGLLLVHSCLGILQKQVSILIKDALIVDGSGRTPYSGDIWITDGRIEGIGRAPKTMKAETTINAQGMALAPGFIDLHAHGDPYNSTGDFQNFLYQGVTTICLGMDGFSSKDLSNWLVEASDSSFALNIAMFTGHSSIRIESGIGYNTNPSKNQIEVVSSILDSTLQNGSFGLSTGLEYRRGGLAKSDELERLANTVGNKGLIMSHLRSEDADSIVTSINELLELGKNASVHISHLKIVYGRGTSGTKIILDLLDSAIEQGIEVTADIYPYNTSFTGNANLFPDWAKQPNDYEKVKRERMRELRVYIVDQVSKSNGSRATIIGKGKWKGLTLKEIEIMESRHWLDVLINDIGPEGATSAYFIMDKVLKKRLLRNRYVAIASDGSPTMNHPRGDGTFAKVIDQFVRKDSLLSLEEAIKKMSSLPANILGIEDRGRIKEGMIADLILFDPYKFKDEATYENPHKIATGMHYVLLNGQIILDNGINKQIQVGKLLYN
jgi:N-acyl-D-amino-acid deacylase